MTGAQVRRKLRSGHQRQRRQGACVVRFPERRRRLRYDRRQDRRRCVVGRRQRAGRLLVSDDLTRHRPRPLRRLVQVRGRADIGRPLADPIFQHRGEPARRHQDDHHHRRDQSVSVVIGIAGGDRRGAPTSATATGITSRSSATSPIQADRSRSGSTAISKSMFRAIPLMPGRSRSIASTSASIQARASPMTFCCGTTPAAA